jgi:hypothetical protein
MARKKIRSNRNPPNRKVKTAPLRSAAGYLRKSRKTRHAGSVLAASPSPAVAMSRVVGLCAEMPLRIAHCKSPFDVWLENLRFGQRLLAAWQL